MKYLAVLGRQPELSLAELAALFGDARQISPNLATFSTDSDVDINRLGGSLKIAKFLDQKPLDFLANLPDGKITFGLSDYSKSATTKSTNFEALKLKQILTRHGRSVRVVENKSAILSSATALHNGLNGNNPRKVELIKFNKEYYHTVGVQDIDAYARRDQARPARDAFVGMLPPKLAQILINLCGPLPKDARILDPFCGTGVVLQEALLMGYRAYGTDISEKMVDYSNKNLGWLTKSEKALSKGVRSAAARVVAPKPLWRQGFWTRPEKELFQISQGDATVFQWNQPIDAVACEAYLGQPMSLPPAEIKLKQEMQKCREIIIKFLKNLAPQITSGTPVVIAIPAWLRPDGTYSRTKNLDEINQLGYNVSKQSRDGLLYHRDGQVVARDIIILRKV